MKGLVDGKNGILLQRLFCLLAMRIIRNSYLLCTFFLYCGGDILDSVCKFSTMWIGHPFKSGGLVTSYRPFLGPKTANVTGFLEYLVLKQSTNQKQIKDAQMNAI